MCAPMTGAASGVPTGVAPNRVREMPGPLPVLCGAIDPDHLRLEIPPPAACRRTVRGPGRPVRRTVQRRIQGLMVQAGATTRIQLGWYARHHGWT